MIKPFAMVFPGQGSQSVKMLNNFALEYPEIKTYFYRASSVLGYDLWNLVQKGPKKELNKTWKTQPALLTASFAIYRIWVKKNGEIPTIMAGHSLGEYSALVCSKAIDFYDALKLVELRGKLMQKASPQKKSSMKVIIGLNNKKVLKICKSISNKNKVVEVANFNAPQQVVISGDLEAVEKVCNICKSVKVKKIISLPVSISAHCSLMKSVSEKLKFELKKIQFQKPSVPVLSSCNINFFHYTPNNICNTLTKQIYTPVYWTKCVKFMKKKGISAFLEIGPGNVLTNLIKRIVSTLPVIAINNQNSLLKAIKNNIIW